MQTWLDILDQSTAVDQLRRAYAADRLPHGMVFAGPAGVGKATTAGVLGTLFLCERPRADQACGTCQSCGAMDASSHPDYHVVTKELIRLYDSGGKSKAVQFSIDVVRPEVLEKAARGAVMGRGKVFLIEQADLLTAGAQNAMLKTLEEPAGRTLVILNTDAPDQLLQTIRSRCQTVRFGEMAAATVVAELKRRGVADAADAARVAGGSLGVAMRWAADGVVAAAGELTSQLDGVFAGRPADALADWFKSAADAYAAKQIGRDELSSKDAATREGFGLYLRLSADHVRSRLRVEPDPDRLERACGLIDAIVRAERYLDANVNTGLVFQQLSIALAMAGAG